jgi:hypothetical protein
MYRPDGKVMPAYSTWQPTEGKIQPIASAVQSVRRRLVDPRGELIRGNPIASTLLGVFGGPPDPFREGGITAVGSPFPVRPPAPSNPPLTLPNVRNAATREALFRIYRNRGMGVDVRSSDYSLD